MNIELLNKLSVEFYNLFNQKPLLIASPGRINLIGEHTDYNQGFVFPATIDKHIFAALSLSDAGFCRVTALDMNETYDFDLNNIQKKEPGSWKNYVLGVVAGLMDKGVDIQNFNLAFCGDIPLGAGLSSSAALENAVVFGLNELFDAGLNKMEIVEISVKAEHDFADVQCGIMDQFSNLHGMADQALFLNCADMSFKAVPVSLQNYQLMLINTHVKHQLSDSPYNQRKLQCMQGFELLKGNYPELPSLSDARISQLNRLKDEMSEVVYNRCLYVIEENSRVKAAKNALDNQNLILFGALLFESHAGLRDLYEVSCQELDFLVEIAKNEPAVVGSRMMGGGFGGCTINLIHQDGVNDFMMKIRRDYQNTFGLSTSFYKVNISGATKIIEQ